MVTVDDLTRTARAVVDRVGSVAATAASAPGCQVDHLDIARVGIEEGLKLAIRLLRDQSGPTRVRDLDGTADDQPGELPRLAPRISRSPNGR
ncbi:MAG: hypothetical protein IT305_12905 [Chloroflexi bacterium]|nr:hypothetical protein [Chloroflexota bacterium]